MISENLTEIPSFLLCQHQLQVQPPPTQPNKFTYLKVLNLSRNRIKELPIEMFRTSGALLQHLEVLNLNRNQLRFIPAEIGLLKNLQELHLVSNNLRPYQRSLPLNELSQLASITTTAEAEAPPAAAASDFNDGRVDCGNLRLLDLRYNLKLNKQATYDAIQSSLPQNHCVNVKLLTTSSRPDDDDDDGEQPSQKKKLHACDRDATLLQSQLEPLSTPTLRQRLLDDFNYRFEGIDTEFSHDRDYIMKHLLNAYKHEFPPHGERPKVFFEGRPLRDDSILKDIYDEFRKWIVEQDKLALPRERPKINACHYMILRTPEEFTTCTSKKQELASKKLAKYQTLWNLAKDAIDQVVDSNEPFHYTAVAVTHNFTGSPHIDTQNIGPFYAISFGNYNNNDSDQDDSTSTSGNLCVELNSKQVGYVDTHHKFAQIDGRYVHWVAPYHDSDNDDNGNNDGSVDRYSLIYYRTVGDEVTPQTSAVLPPTKSR